jgi:hypothetical protein
VKTGNVWDNRRCQKPILQVVCVYTQLFAFFGSYDINLKASIAYQQKTQSIIDSTFCGSSSTEIVQHASYKTQSDSGSYDPYKIRTTRSVSEDRSSPKLNLEEEKTV